jgi:hypothetical protein
MKATEILKRIMTELSSVNSVEVKFAQMKLENGTALEAEAFEAGNEVFIVNEEERIALPVGEYSLEDGKILVVVEEGIISEVKEAAGEEMPEEEAPSVEVEVEASESNPKKVVESHTTETHFAEEEVSVEVPAEVAPAIEEMVNAVVEVVKPMIEEVQAAMESLRQEMGLAKQEMAAKEQEVETMKAELSAQSASKPIKHNPSTTPKAEVKMATNRPASALDRVLAKMNK